MAIDGIVGADLDADLVDASKLPSYLRSWWLIRKPIIFCAP